MHYFLPVGKMLKLLVIHNNILRRKKKKKRAHKKITTQKLVSGNYGLKVDYDISAFGDRNGRNDPGLLQVLVGTRV